MAPAESTYGPEKAITEVQHIVKSPVTSASVEKDMLFGHDLHLSTSPDPAASAATDDDERSEVNVQLYLAEKVILHLDPSIPGSLVEDSAGKYLSAVDKIILLSGHRGNGDIRGHVKSLLETTMSRLRKEFQHIITVQSANLDPDHRSFQSFSRSTPSEYSDLATDDFSTLMEEEQQVAQERRWYSLLDEQTSSPIPSKVISNLKEIADRMIVAGYQQELYQVYCSARLDFLNGYLSVLEVDESSIEHAQTIEWKTFQEKFKKWARKLYFIVWIFLPRERRLCGKIFVASDELREESFKQTVECFFLQLLSHGDVITSGLQSPSSIIDILQSYEALSDVLPDIQALFSGDSEQFRQAEQIVERLGKMVRVTLAKVYDTMRSVNLSKPWQSCQIHPMVTYVMTYIKILVDYSSSLYLLLADGGVDGEDSSAGDESMIPSSHHVYLLVSDLECKLEEQSKLYDDAGMSYIFLMNNLLYMVKEVNDFNLNIQLGDDWIRKHRWQIRQHATSYLRASWTKVLSCLKDDGLGGSRSSNNVTRKAPKERFKNFNLAIEEIYRTQTKWKVPDSQLREELRISISEKVIPAYRSFVGRFHGQLEGGRDVAKYVKYTPEDIENCLSNLFEGCPSPPSHHRRTLMINARGEAMAAAAANSDGPEKSIAELQHIVESPVASSSMEDDTLCHDLHISTSPDLADDDDERSEAKVRLDVAEKVILRLDPSIPGSFVEGSAGEFLSAVDEIIFLSGGGVDGEARSHATSLLRTAMSLLRTEFRHIISVHSANLDFDCRSFQTFSWSMPSEYSDLTTEDSGTWMEEELHPEEERGWYSLSDESSNLIPSEVIYELKEIADRMIAAGYQQELCQAYSSARQDFLNEFLSVPGADQLSIELLQTIEWKTLRAMVVKWARRLNHFVSVLLPCERELCDQIFVASDELKEESFRKTAKYFVLQQLNLGDMIAARLQSQQGVFLLLDIYEAFSDLQPLFSGDSEEFICGEVEQIAEKLGRMVRGALANFEDGIRSKRLWNPEQSGPIDQMVRYVMNYLRKLVRYSRSLNLLLHDDGVDGGDDSVRDEGMTPFGQRTHLFLSFTECRIQETSKFYKNDDALKYIFLMNNMHCMVVKVEDSELKALLGDDWVRTRRRQIEQYATCYLRTSWSKPLSYVKDDGLISRRGGLSMVALKRKFRKFNLAFENVWCTQKAWIVPDPRLRQYLRLLILTAVLPGYRTFFGTQGDKLEGGQQISKYLEYTPEELEYLLSDMFEGAQNSDPDHRISNRRSEWNTISYIPSFKSGYLETSPILHAKMKSDADKFYFMKKLEQLHFTKLKPWKGHMRSQSI